MVELKNVAATRGAPADASASEPARYRFDAEGRYIVRSDDTLSELAHAWGVRMAELAELNGLDMSLYGHGLATGADRPRDPDVLRSGQKLVVPESVLARFGGAAGADKPKAEAPANESVPTDKVEQTPAAGAPVGQGETEARQALKPKPGPETTKQDAKGPEATKEGLANKAFDLLQKIFSSKLVGLVLMFTPFFPSLGTAIWGIIGILQLGTFVADWLAKDKDGKGPDWFLLGSGLLMAASGWTGISVLANLGGFALFAGNASKPNAPAPSPAGAQPLLPQVAQQPPTPASAPQTDPVDEAFEGSPEAVAATSAPGIDAETERLAEEQRQQDASDLALAESGTSK